MQAVFYNRTYKICISQEKLDMYPESLFSLIHRFEGNREHSVIGFEDNEILKIEEFYTTGEWNKKFGTQSFFPIYQTKDEYIQGECCLDYLGLPLDYFDNGFDDYGFESDSEDENFEQNFEEMMNDNFEEIK